MKGVPKVPMKYMIHGQHAEEGSTVLVISNSPGLTYRRMVEILQNSPPACEVHILDDDRYMVYNTLFDVKVFFTKLSKSLLKVMPSNTLLFSEPEVSKLALMNRFKNKFTWQL